MWTCNGVIKIARRFSVNGDDGQLTEIASVAQISFAHFRRDAARFLDYFRWKNVR
jgi:hypothetical protein